MPIGRLRLPAAFEVKTSAGPCPQALPHAGVLKIRRAVGGSLATPGRVSVIAAEASRQASAHCWAAVRHASTSGACGRFRTPQFRTCGQCNSWRGTHGGVPERVCLDHDSHSTEPSRADVIAPRRVVRICSAGCTPCMVQWWGAWQPACRASGLMPRMRSHHAMLPARLLKALAGAPRTWWRSPARPQCPSDAVGCCAACARTHL